jgi:hypothetical protein
MAKVKLDSMFTENSGHLDNIVYYTVWGKTYARKYVIPHNPKSEAQQAHRSLFAEGMAEWKLQSDEVKQQYRKKTRKLPMHAHNLFISDYIEAHKHDKTAESVNTEPEVKALLNTDTSEYKQHRTHSVASLYGLRIKELSGIIQTAYTLNAPPF